MVSATFFTLSVDGNQLYAKSLRGKMKEAMPQYEQGDYEQALDTLMDVEVEHPGEPIIDYNIGNTYYKQERYDEAIEKYQQAILNGSAQLKSMAHYNIGNSLYRQSQQSESAGTLDEALQQMRESLEAYKAALADQPDDTEVKQNIELVQRSIKRLLDKIKQQQEQQQQQGQQGQQDQQQNQQQGQQQQSGQGQQQKDQQGQQQQGQQGDQQQEQGDEQEEQGKQARQEQDNDSGAEKENDGKGAFKADKDKQQQEQGEQERQGKESEEKQGEQLSPQEAQRLLDHLPEHKKKSNRQLQRGYSGEVEQNW